MDLKDNPKKPLYLYYLIAMGIILIFNTFILPTLMKCESPKWTTEPFKAGRKWACRKCRSSG